MKINNRNYIQTKKITAATIIEIEAILEFCQFVENHNIKDIFITSSPSNFAVLNNNALLSIPSLDFHCLEDYKKAFQNNFSNAKDYYDAKALKIENFEEYELNSKFGIKDFTIINKMKAEGYLEGIKEFLAFITKKHSKELQNIENSFQLYTYAQEKEFNNFEEFFNTIKGGFFDINQYNVAKEKGFETASDYEDALKKGFTTNESYELAKIFNIDSYQELVLKINIESGNPGLAHDKCILLELLSKLEEKKKVSLNKLSNLLKNTIQENYSINDTSFDWFKIELTDDDAIVDFLITNEKATLFGTYDKDGEFFEVFQIQNRSIVLDGSNVAHNSINGIREKPSVANLIKMVNYLKKKGFAEILIISDASLRHKLEDKERLEELDKIATHLISPAGTSADIYLISYVKEKLCLLVSNDTFKEYKLSDPWTAINIDFYRLTFMITKDSIFMPDLK